MKLNMKLSLTDESGQRFFGSGVYQLLVGTRETGSLRKAALGMEIAYSKAFHIVKRAEEHFGFALTERRIGGPGGGGSKLTKEAEELIQRYEGLMNECRTLSGQLFEKYFADFDPSR